MLHKLSWLGVAAVCCLWAVPPAPAYVDLVPTLARIIRESRTITLAEVDRFNPEKGAVILKKVRDLKGETGAEPIKHQLVRTNETAMDRPIQEWAEPGQRCVIFLTGKAGVVCVGEGWYQIGASDDDWSAHSGRIVLTCRSRITGR